MDFLVYNQKYILRD